MPRLVRRAPFSQRIRAYLDFSDWRIWISESLDTSDLEESASNHALIFGCGAQLLFILAQANSGAFTSADDDDDDFFGDTQGSGWMGWLMSMLVLLLGLMSFGNTWLVWGKRRNYRLFEQSIEVAPQTPSARRVRVDSSPASGSPMSFVRNLVQNNAAARAHPMAGRDVWEVAVWDPNPLCLELFCLFNPLHVVLYYLDLPVTQLDPTPSVRVAKTVLIGAGISFVLWWQRAAFLQRDEDNSLIKRQVFHEYDSKFVHPSMQKPCRDVGIQTISKNSKRDSSVGVKGSSHDLASEVVTYTPTTIINRVFRTNPNSSYAAQYDPDNLASATVPRPSQSTPSLRREYTSASTATGTGAEFSSPIRPSHTPNPFRQAPAIPRTSNDGGYLGIKTHAASPLRKSSSTTFERSCSRGGRDSVGDAGERRLGSPTKREGSPLKRISLPSVSGERERGLGGEKMSGFADRLERSSSSSSISRSGYGNLGVGRRESGRY